jgi:hypothetical protein
MATMGKDFNATDVSLGDTTVWMANSQQQRMNTFAL